MIPVQSAVERLISKARIQMIIACTEHNCSQHGQVVSSQGKMHKMVLAQGVLLSLPAHFAESTVYMAANAGSVVWALGTLAAALLTTQVTRMQSKTMSALPGIASRLDRAAASAENSSVPISLSLPLCARGDGVGRFLTCIRDSSGEEMLN